MANRPGGIQTIPAGAADGGALRRITVGSTRPGDCTLPAAGEGRCGTIDSSGLQQAAGAMPGIGAATEFAAVL